MDPSGSIFSSTKVEKWDRAEVKDLTDYLTVKESTTENTVKIWPSLLKYSSPQNGVTYLTIHLNDIILDLEFVISKSKIIQKSLSWKFFELQEDSLDRFMTMGSTIWDSVNFKNDFVSSFSIDH